MKKVFFALVVLLLLAGCQSQFMTGGKVYYQSGQYDKAIEQFKKAIEAEPNNYAAYLWLGKAYSQKKMWEEAAKMYAKAMEIDKEKALKEMKNDPMKPNPYWYTYDQAARHYMKKEEFQKAFDYNEKALTLANDKETKFNSLIMKGAILTNIGKVDEAEKYYDEAIKIDPDNPEPYRLLGHQYLKNGDYENAAKYFEIAAEKSNNNTNILMLLAASYLNGKKFDKAIDTYKRILSSGVEDGLVYLNLGNAYREAGKEKEAIEPYLKALKLLKEKNDKNVEVVYTNLGYIYYDLKMYDKCIELLSEAIKVNPNNCNFYLLIYDSYVAKKDIKNAKIYMKKYENCSGEK